MCSTVFLAFDADAAGEEASLRGMALAEANGALRCGSWRFRRAATPPTSSLADPDGVRPLGRVGGGRAHVPRRPGARGSAGRATRSTRASRAIIAAAAPSVERDEQVRLVADRLRLTDDLDGPR